MARQKVVTIVGTRPEVIKMAPVVREIERHNALFDHILVTTAQHREMLDQALEVFNLKPDVDLGLMQGGQGLADFSSRALESLSNLLARLQPDTVLIQGDTTTAMIASLAAFYKSIQVGHVEAGLRTGERRQPFPEEINRRLIAVLADLHFAPTERARGNLKREGVADRGIFVTGNTIVDALRTVSLDGGFESRQLSDLGLAHKRVLLVTAHRRESHGAPLRSICHALKTLAARATDIEIVYPLHLNPDVSLPVREMLGDSQRIHLIDPVSYRDLLRLMKCSYLILTDSGGIQEEAPSFRRPVLVLREVTERPELIEANAGKVVGTDSNRIIEAVERLLSDEREYQRMVPDENPFGDGRAAERIVGILASEV
jgi:UDP-N-acetylglucosamine 2-epimerase (non-hydrolysing)